MRKLSFFALKILLIVFCFQSHSYSEISDWQFSENSNENAKVRLLSSIKNIEENKGGNKYLLAILQIKLKDGWKIYGPDSHEIGFAPQVMIDGEIYKSHKIKWPESIPQSEKIGLNVLNYSIYKDEVYLPVEITLKNYQQKEKNINIHLNYGLCKEICIPASNEFEISDFIVDENVLKIAREKSNKQDDNSLLSDKKLFGNSGSIGVMSLCYGILAAFLGGLILNIMPCVLPVLGLKLMSVIKHQDATSSKVRFAFASTILGILFSFIVFAGFSISLAKAGEVFNWGIQFQNPYFLISVILILAFFVANLLGLFEINANRFLANLLNRKVEKEKKKIFVPNFLSGLLAVTLATPCSAPFLGAAISFSITQSPLIIALIFIAMGIGFAFPYFILIFYPKAVNKLPKSGSWMLSLKKFMAGLLIATITWLLYVLYGNIGFFVTSVVSFVSIFIVVAMKIGYGFLRYFVILSLLIVAICSPSKFENLKMTPVHKSDSLWKPLKVEKIDDYVKSGKIVIIDVTADWCLTCKFNKYKVLRDDEVVTRLKKQDIVAMRGDITRPNKKIMDFVNSHNRFAIPFNVIYGPNNENGVLASEILNKAKFLELINNVAKNDRSYEVNDKKGS